MSTASLVSRDQDNFCLGLTNLLLLVCVKNCEAVGLVVTDVSPEGK